MAEVPDIVVIGASAGGVEALTALLGAVPTDLDAAVFVVLHLPPTGGPALARILDRAGPLPAANAVDGEPVKPGRVYVAVGDHHLLVSDGVVLVRRGPRENGHRPGVDPLFRSAARWYGSRVVGIVLSGTLDDGVAGLSAIQRQGGTVLVQDPDDAEFADMPKAALRNVEADLVATAAELGVQLGALSAVRKASDPVPPDAMLREVELLESFETDVAPHSHHGEPSQWPCPDCSGVLWHLPDDVLRFRCRVGHAWSAESLAVRQDEEIETALWAALRALEDRGALTERMAQRAADAGRGHSAERWRADAAEIDKSAAVLRRLLEEQGAGSETGA